MADLFFPQLASGALAQYPIRKHITNRTIRNMLPDGSLVLYPDSSAAHIIWEFAYEGLTVQEVNDLTALFAACQGRLRSFNFIDPTDNMLAQSTNLAASAWIAQTGLSVIPSAPDPFGGTGAFILTNTTQNPVQLSQTIFVPANYQYSFSIYANSLSSSSVELVRSSSTAQQVNDYQMAANWSRLVSSGALSDSANELTVSIVLSPGSQANVFGPQLEAQPSPSRYRATFTQSAVYSDAHWAVDSLPITAEAPGLYSTAFAIEAMTSTT